jgi:hypothetical protein
MQYEGEFRRSPARRRSLFHMSQAAITHPDDTCRAALFPVVPGGEATPSGSPETRASTIRAGDRM